MAFAILVVSCGLLYHHKILKNTEISLALQKLLCNLPSTGFLLTGI